MPKKTKKEKIIADYRKKLKFIEQTSPALSSISHSKSPIVTNAAESRQPMPIDNTKIKDMLIYFKKDFRKSLILITGIIGLEICLYFATINQYFKFR